MEYYSFEVLRNDLAATQLVDLPDPNTLSLSSEEAVIRIDQFGLTANNITYGVAGDLIGYWQFFPAADDWGRIPVWGMGTVVRTGQSGLKQGEQYFGYFPMSSYLRVEPNRINDGGFFDGSAHRAELPPAYNQYRKVTPENGFVPGFNAHRMVYSPLFTTGFLLDDWLLDNHAFGAEQVVISSASSKTAFSLAYQLHRRGASGVIGLTSQNNLHFVQGLGLYDQVLCYDEVAAIDKQRPTAYVDMSGNRPLLAALHHHLNDQLVCSAGVGITHYEARDGEDPASLPGAKPSLFFAPTQMQKRVSEWGGEVYQAKLNAAWEQFVGDVDQWVTICEYAGPEGLSQAYQRVLAGAPPNESCVVSM